MRGLKSSALLGSNDEAGRGARGVIVSESSSHRRDSREIIQQYHRGLVQVVVNPLAAIISGEYIKALVLESRRVGFTGCSSCGELCLDIISAPHNLTPHSLISTAGDKRASRQVVLAPGDVVDGLLDVRVDC